MSALPRRPLVNAAVILGVGVFALGAAPSIPVLSKAGLKLVEKLGLKLDPTPSAFSGDGSPEQPWQRWKSKPAPPQEPIALLTIDQDEDGRFSSSPPSPVDLAVVFKILHEAGHRHLGCGYLMAWEQPDSLGRKAVRQRLDAFDSAVLGLPLSRGAAGQPLPSAFLRMSVEASQIQGDTSVLPQVNKVASPEAELGGAKSQAGFTLLENELPAKDSQPLLARWGDRIVFALPLAAEIAALGIDPAEVKVTLGHEIRVGLDGPVVPIDALGRTAPVAAPLVVDTPAWKLIDKVIPAPSASSPLLIRDGRLDLPAPEGQWSESLPGMAQAIRSAPRYERPLTLQRLPVLAELALILLIAFFAAWATWIRNFFWRILAVGLAAAFAAELLYLLSAHRNLWLPPLPVAGMCGASLLLAIYWERKKQPAVDPRPWESPDFQLPVQPAEPEPVAPARPRPAPVAAPAPLPVPVPAPAPVPAVASAPAPLPAIPLTRVKFVNGSVVLPESARATWGRPQEEAPEPQAIAEEPAPLEEPAPQPIEAEAPVQEAAPIEEEEPEPPAPQPAEPSPAPAAPEETPAPAPPAQPAKKTPTKKPPPPPKKSAKKRRKKR